jgi:hypothetical protein
VRNYGVTDGHAGGFLLLEHSQEKRLEHQSHRQERNFIDRERLSGEMNSEVQNQMPPSECWSEDINTYIHIYTYICLSIHTHTHTHTHILLILFY